MAASHTATGEWKSFELRMRRRRAERLVVRAEAAAGQGRIEEARACLEEARTLVPGLPAIDAVQQKLDAPPVHGRASTARVRMAAALAVACALLVLAIVFARPIWQAAPITVATAHDFRGLNLDAPLLASPPPIVRLRPEPADEPIPAANEADDPAPAPPPLPAAQSAAALRTTVPRVPVEPTADVPAATRASLSAPPVSTPPTTVAPPVVAPPAPSPPPPAITTAPVAAVPVAASAPAASVPSSIAAAGGGEDEVRGTLDRYAAAYTALDAAAAERVWPNVNRAALSRAFEGLASQRVTLGNCRIEVNGATARASCAGSTTWAPKVGDGSPRTDARRWTFDLVRNSDSWKIVSARVQNR